MKILLAPDKFKGSLSAKGVIASLKKGVLKYDANCVFYEVLVSDGGDGFLDAVSMDANVQRIEVRSLDPLGRTKISNYGYDISNHKAYVELANTSGLSLLEKHEYNVLATSTYGAGIQIQDAINKGAKEIYVGLGGSATNDGGIGIASALGYQFLDNEGNVLSPKGEQLKNIHLIKSPEKPLDSVKIFAVNDVQNVLYGPFGASYTYARQKGADDKTIRLLDNGLQHLDKIVKTQLGKDMAEIPGSGAAGGTAYGLKVFCNAAYISGIEFVLKLNQTEQLLKKHKFDLIITGEGKIDTQTQYGKVIKGVSSLGNDYGIPVIAVCGTNEIDAPNKEAIGLDDIIEIRDVEKSLQYNLDNASLLLEDKIFQYFQSKQYKLNL